MKINFKSPNPKGIITWLINQVHLRLSDGDNDIHDRVWQRIKDSLKVKQAISDGTITLLTKESEPEPEPEPETKTKARRTTQKESDS